MGYDVTATLSDIGIDYKLEGSLNEINAFSSIEEATEPAMNNIIATSNFFDIRTFTKFDRTSRLCIY